MGEFGRSRWDGKPIEQIEEKQVKKLGLSTRQQINKTRRKIWPRKVFHSSAFADVGAGVSSTRSISLSERSRASFSKKIEKVQACNISEVLSFQSGLRVETDCQTCNYTQLRINGLSGGYSQILINGKAIFSPLAGMYAMEQIPSNMIERIEVIKGGGSSLYGSSAIGGVVNLITKLPKTNSFDFGYSFRRINETSL